MMVDLNLAERSLIALLIVDEVNLIKQYRSQVVSETALEYADEKIDAYQEILAKI